MTTVCVVFYNTKDFYGQLILQKCSLFGFIEVFFFFSLFALFLYYEQWQKILCERLVMLSSLFKVICTAEGRKNSEKEHAVYCIKRSKKRLPLRNL